MENGKMEAKNYIGEAYKNIVHDSWIFIFFIPMEARR